MNRWPQIPVPHEVLMGSVNRDFRGWADPINWRDPALGINKSAGGFGSPFSLGAYLLMADGSVRLVSDSVSAETLRALSTPAGHEPVGEF